MIKQTTAVITYVFALLCYLGFPISTEAHAAVADELTHVDQNALLGYLNSSVFKVSICTKELCTDDINDYKPEGTATLFYVSKPCAMFPLLLSELEDIETEELACRDDRAVIYFITAAHVINSRNGCAPTENGDTTTLESKPIFLSRAFPDQRTVGSSSWLELVMRTEEVSRMKASCDKKQLGANADKFIKFDVSVLKLVSAALYTRTSDYDGAPMAESGSHAGVPLDTIETVRLLSDGYSRHALLGFRYLGFAQPTLPGTLERGDRDIGYFSGYPFEKESELFALENPTKTRMDPSRLRRKYFEIRSNTPLRAGEITLRINPASPSRPVLELLPEDIHPRLKRVFQKSTGAESLVASHSRRAQKSAGFSGSTIHYYHAGRLHIIGVLHGRGIPAMSEECAKPKSKRSFSTTPLQCDYIFFTRMDSRVIWKLFSSLTPTTTVSVLVEKFLRGKIDDIDIASFQQFDDLELFWFGLALLNDEKYRAYIFEPKLPDRKTRVEAINSARRLLCPSNDRQRRTNFVRFGEALTLTYDTRRFERIAEVLEKCTNDMFELAELRSSTELVYANDLLQKGLPLSSNPGTHNAARYFASDSAKSALDDKGIANSKILQRLFEDAQLANLVNNAGNRNKILSKYNHLSGLDKSHPLALMALAEIRLSMGRTKEANKIAAQALAYSRVSECDLDTIELLKTSNVFRKNRFAIADYYLEYGEINSMCEKILNGTHSKLLYGARDTIYNDDTGK